MTRRTHRTRLSWHVAQSFSSVGAAIPLPAVTSVGPKSICIDGTAGYTDQPTIGCTRQNIASSTVEGDAWAAFCPTAATSSDRATLGSSYQATEFVSLNAAHDFRAKPGSPIVGSIPQDNLTARLKFKLAYELTAGQESSGGSLHHSTNTLNIHVTKTADLELVFTWNGMAEPQAAADESFLSRAISVSAFC